MRLPPADNFRSPAAILRYVGVAVIGIAVDLFTKALAVQHLGPVRSGRSIPLLPGWLHFEYTENRGAVFGLGQGQQALFVGVSVVAVVFLTWLFAVSARKQRLYQILLGMLLAGVIGNMYDRLTLGHVRDMIHALPHRSWPGTWQVPLLNYPEMPGRSVFPFIFNVADTLLCTGVFLMIVYSFFHKPNEEKATTDFTDYTDSKAGARVNPKSV